LKHRFRRRSIDISKDQPAVIRQGLSRRSARLFGRSPDAAGWFDRNSSKFRLHNILSPREDLDRLQCEEEYWMIDE